jgi:hypothetical protein
MFHNGQTERQKHQILEAFTGQYRRVGGAKMRVNLFFLSLERARQWINIWSDKFQLGATRRRPACNQIWAARTSTYEEGGSFTFAAGGQSAISWGSHPLRANQIWPGKQSGWTSRCTIAHKVSSARTNTQHRQHTSHLLRTQRSNALNISWPVPSCAKLSWEKRFSTRNSQFLAFKPIN